MILTGKQIDKEILKGKIKITNFDEKNLNPNSYDVTLAEDLAFYKYDELDMKIDNEYVNVKITNDGYVLRPGILYLARTNEKTITDHYAPMIEGRSSVGRLGIQIHSTAGFGDVGFDGYWTLEITVTQPVKIYPNVRIGQVYFHEVTGEIELYKGKYQSNDELQGSKMYKDFATDTNVDTKFEVGDIVKSRDSDKLYKIINKDNHHHKYKERASFKLQNAENNTVYWYDEIMLNELFYIVKEKKEPNESDLALMDFYFKRYNYRWFVRNNSGFYIVHKEKPYKNQAGYWKSNKDKIMLESWLSHLSFEDDEPYYYEPKVELKVGDKVWVKDFNKNVIALIIKNKGVTYYEDNGIVVYYETEYKDFNKSDIGKTVFLTKEECEKGVEI